MSSNLLYRTTLSLCGVANDEFIEYKHHWIATLSDGSRIYQDDDRPGEEIPSAWLRLKEWLSYTNLESDGKIWIQGLHLRFRSNIINPLPTNAKGYFFANKIVQMVGGKPYDFFVVGTVEDKVIKRQTFKVPEMIKVAEDIKPLDENYERFVIMRS